jgi:hypothetical protein
VASETTTANPELIQTEVANILVQPLKAARVVLASGVRIFDTSGSAAHHQGDGRPIGRIRRRVGMNNSSFRPRGASPAATSAGCVPPAV